MNDVNRSAHIVSDGCRDYLVRIHGPEGSHYLGGWKLSRRPRRFRSIHEARSAITRNGIRDIKLRMRIADDEISTGGSSHFETIPLS